MLSQQLRASRLSSGLNVSDHATDGEHLHPNAGGAPTHGSQKLDRTISTSSMGRSAGDRIDEEEETGTDDGLFEMEDEGRDRNRKVKNSVQVPPLESLGVTKQTEISGHNSQEITPTATGAGVQEPTKTTTPASAKVPQPTQSRWVGGGAWNIVAAAGNKMGLTSPTKPAEAGQTGRPAASSTKTK